MKRAAIFLAVANLILLVTVAAVFSQTGPKLFSLSEPAKADEKLPPSVKKVSNDIEAVKAWWRELHGSEAKELRIVELTPSRPLRYFEVDIGDKLRPHWIGLADWLKEEGRDAHAFSAKIAADKASPPQSWLFVVKDGEVIYQKQAFKRVP